MKTSKRTITFFSFFPVAVLLATPLMFSTFVPASTDDYYSAGIGVSDWVVPQSQLVLEKVLKAGDARNGEIEEVKFLDYGDSIYGGGDNASSLISSSPAILDSGEIDTAYVLQNPEFQRQVEEVKAQAEAAEAPMPPLLTLVALFAFAMATGSATLKEFFKFSTYTEQVEKTIQVTKKVARTVYRTITEKVARKVKTIKQVAYTAYKSNVVQVISPPSVEKLEEMARFMRKSVKENPSFSRPFERNARYYLPNMSNRSEWDNFKSEYDDIAVGTRVGGTVHRLQEYFSSPAHTDVKRSLNTISDYFFEGIRFTEPALYEKLKEEFDAIVRPVIEPPVADSTGTPYTAYHDEVETKTVYDTVTREVPETIYENVTEDKEITEDITKHSFTPDDEKIDLAMGYLKNYSQILRSPSNRNFADDVILPNRDIPLFAGAYETYSGLVLSLRDANIYNYESTNPEALKEIFRRHNEFIYSMKGILKEIQKGQTPQEQMGILFGKTYADSVGVTERQLEEIETQERAISARFEEIYQLRVTNKISEGYYRSLYSSAKQNRDQIYRRKRDTEKYLKKSKEDFTRRFNGTITSLQNLAFLRNLDDWRSTLNYGQRQTPRIASTPANLTVSGLKPVFTGYSSSSTANFVATGGDLSTLNPKGNVLAVNAAKAGITFTTKNGKLIANNIENPANQVAANLKKAGVWNWLKNYVNEKVANTTKAAMPFRTLATITADNLNVRSEPSDANKDTIITQLNSGDKVEIIGKTKDEKWLNVRLSNGKKGWIINNPEWIKAPALENMTVVKTLKPVYIPGEYSLAGDETVRKAENHILNTIVKNPPVNGLGGSWIATLGSGWHDDNSFHALDLGMGSNADKGKDIVSVADGTISKIDLSYGSVMMGHPKGKDTPAWQSNYLHMPLYKAVDTPKEPEALPTDRLTKDGKQIYVLHTADTVDKDGNFVEGTEIEGFEIWEGMEVKAGDKIGVIDGRGISGRGGAGTDGKGRKISDDAFDDHLHFEARLSGKTINMALAAQNGWRITVTAMGGGVRNVIWSNKVDIGNLGGAWINEGEKLIFFRDPAITSNPDNDYWLAWEDGKSVGEMKRVVWETQKEKGYEKGIARWRESDNPGSFWESSERKFKPVEIIK